MGYSIAIDGPAGAGKSTIAKKVAAKKGCCYVDTGAIYRAMAYFLLENGVKGEETDRIAKKCQEANIRVAYEAGEQQVFLNGENVNSKYGFGRRKEPESPRKTGRASKRTGF